MDSSDLEELDTPNSTRSGSTKTRIDIHTPATSESELSKASNSRRPSRSAARAAITKLSASSKAAREAIKRDQLGQDSNEDSDGESHRQSPTRDMKSPSKKKDIKIEVSTSAEDSHSEDAFKEESESEDSSAHLSVDEADSDASVAASLKTKKQSKVKVEAEHAVSNFRAIAKGKGKATIIDDDSDSDAAEQDNGVSMEDFVDENVSSVAKKRAPKKTKANPSKKAKKAVISDSEAQSAAESAKSEVTEAEESGSSGVSDDEDAPKKKKTPSQAKKPAKGKKAPKGAAYPPESKDEKKERLAREKEFRKKRNGKLNHYERNQLQLERIHPELVNVWGELEATVSLIEPVKAEQPEKITMRLLPFQLEGLHWMQEQERGPWKGGMLADEMGMGKTIQTISLIVSDLHEDRKDKKMILVIAPTVAIVQWRNEFSKFTKNVDVKVWHGANRASDIKSLKKHDVILTSYNVLESAFRRQHKGFMKNKEKFTEDSILHKIKWHRIVLDEAHNIKDRGSNTAKATFALKAKYRWCLSGTPLQNRVGELYSLIRFLGVLPFAANFCKRCDCTSLHWSFSNKKHCDSCGHTPMQHCWFWNNEILKPIQRYGHGGAGSTAFKKLKTLLDRMMLRRTKVERADDLELPPRTVLVRRDYFTEEEEELYTSLYSDIKRNFDTYLDAGTVLNNYASIFTLIIRLRQMACHPDLVLKSKTAKSIQNLLKSSEDASMQICRVCLDEAEDPVMSKCRHVYCRECVRPIVEGTGTDNAPECVVCHLPLTINLDAPSLETDGAKVARQGILDRIDPTKWRTSTKIEALVEELAKLKSDNHSAKSLVFAQSTSFLDLVARRLQLSGFKTARLQGSMTPEARDRTVRYFMDNVDVSVFLLSIKAGGVALNLTEASHVFICDPWWNPAVEYQAMDRIHRIGQRRPVTVKRLIIENSIESRILDLQKKKESMIGAAFGDSEALGRLTPEDLRFLFVL